MGPNYWKKRSTELKKCSEFSLGKSCPEPVFDDCCKIVACSYCLELDMYGEDLKSGIAEFNSTKYTGEINGLSFELFVRRNEYTNICETVVLLDGQEIYIRSCEEGMSCRDLSDEVDIVIDYESGTLSWYKVEPLPLPHIEHPDTGCKTWFCGECECTSECLCVKIVEPDGNQISGEICNINYDCGAPNWEGAVGNYNLAVALERGEDGECLIVSSVDGEEQTPTVIINCNNISITIELYDGTVITLASKICVCEDLYNMLCCPEPMGPVVYVSGGLISGSVALTCQNCTADNQNDYIARIYTGEYITDWLYATGYGSLCTVTHNWKVKIRLFFTWTCGSGMTLSISATIAENAPGYDIAILDSSVVETVTVECSPLLNMYDLCPANGFYYSPNPCFGAIDRCTEFPETYVVTE